MSVSVALIPARAGSKRIPNKNLRILRGRPLVAIAIEQAKKTNLFSEIIVSTDSLEIANVAMEFGALVPSLRPSEFASDTSPDIEWVLHCLNSMVKHELSQVEFMAILRPTSPLRTSTSIVQGFHKLKEHPSADSLRAMEVTHRHPGKMWYLDNNSMAKPFMTQSDKTSPTFNSPTQILPKVWVQNASLEWARVKRVIETRSISGEAILGFEMPGYEGLDINTEEDLEFVKFLLQNNPNLLS